MVAILQLKASKLIVYFVSFTVVIFTILNTDWEKYRESVKSSYALNKIINMDIKDETTTK